MDLLFSLVKKFLNYNFIECKKISVLQVFIKWNKTSLPKFWRNAIVQQVHKNVRNKASTKILRENIQALKKVISLNHKNLKM